MTISWLFDGSYADDIRFNENDPETSKEHPFYYDSAEIDERTVFDKIVNK